MWYIDVLDANPEKRPSVEKLREIIYNWICDPNNGFALCKEFIDAD